MFLLSAQINSTLLNVDQYKPFKIRKYLNDTFLMDSHTAVDGTALLLNPHGEALTPHVTLLENKLLKR